MADDTNHKGSSSENRWKRRGSSIARPSSSLENLSSPFSAPKPVNVPSGVGVQATHSTYEASPSVADGSLAPAAPSHPGTPRAVGTVHGFDHQRAGATPKSR